ncbi:Ribosomal small subunit pseudouridine synthase A [bioreactor metagenome]|uniref:Ribosomal small subunit pseudouridine synthase A n=1 Tax=bioreactor metagenome TaxID=1076179 RepID=A0A644ZRV6_9ZZZZ
MERLDKIISSYLNISRTDARRLIKNAGVTIDGKIVKEASQKADTLKQCIKFGENEIVFQKFCYIMMNKPAGVVSVSKDPEATTVVDIVPDDLKKRGLFPAGRLDKDTVGFIILTNDGDFAHRILSPKKHIEKTYLAKIKHPLTAKEIAAFENGILLKDGTQCMDGTIRQLTDENDVWAEIKIREGKYHQIKRMLAALDNEVLYLKRTAMGALELDKTLKEGECRLIAEEELEKIQIRSK